MRGSEKPEAGNPYKTLLFCTKDERMRNRELETARVEHWKQFGLVKTSVSEQAADQCRIAVSQGPKTLIKHCPFAHKLNAG